MRRSGRRTQTVIKHWRCGKILFPAVPRTKTMVDAGQVNENWQQCIRLYLPADNERAKPKGKHRKVQVRVNIPRKILVCLTVLQLGLEGATLLK
jgi:hypothetical protein